jgi:hypothetical protein
MLEGHSHHTSLPESDQHPRALANDVAPAGRWTSTQLLTQASMTSEHIATRRRRLKCPHALHCTRRWAVAAGGAALLPSATTRPGATFPCRNDRTHSPRAGSRAHRAFRSDNGRHADRTARPHLVPPGTPTHLPSSREPITRPDAPRGKRLRPPARAMMIDGYAAMMAPPPASESSRAPRSSRAVHRKRPPPRQLAIDRIGDQKKTGTGCECDGVKRISNVTQRQCFAERKSGRKQGKCPFLCLILRKSTEFFRLLAHNRIVFHGR